MGTTLELWKDQRIAELEAQLCEEVEARSKWYCEADLLKEQLAASQAREQQLREALEKIVEPPSEPVLAGLTRLRMLAGGALALPTDDTALRAWGAKLLREAADEIHDDYGSDRDSAATLRRKADTLESKP